MPRIIVIDGASSSGRTSLTKRFAQASSERYCACHIDEFIRKLPVQIWGRCSDTDAGWAEIGMMFNTFLFDVSQRHDRIVADGYYKQDEARDHLFSLFGRERVFYVQLFCELEELERRERLRGDRRLGLARSQFDSIYAFTDYDIRVDSTDASVEDCASQLAMAIAERSAQMS